MKPHQRIQPIALKDRAPGGHGWPNVESTSWGWPKVEESPRPIETTTPLLTPSTTSARQRGRRPSVIHRRRRTSGAPVQRISRPGHLTTARHQHSRADGRTAVNDTRRGLRAGRVIRPAASPRHGDLTGLFHPTSKTTNPLSSHNTHTNSPPHRPINSQLHLEIVHDFHVFLASATSPFFQGSLSHSGTAA